MKFSSKPLKDIFETVKIERYFVETKKEKQKITYYITRKDYSSYLEELRIGKIIQKVRPIDECSYHSGRKEDIIIKLKNLPKDKIGYSNAKVKAKIHYSDFGEKNILEEKYCWGFCNLIEDKSGLIKKVFDIRKFLG